MNQSMFNAWNAIKATALWWSPVLAGFISAFGTHLLTQSREREKWILDNKKQEYRELLSALSESFKSACTFPNGVGGNGHNVVADHVNTVIRITYDRIFIIEDLDLNSVRNRWSEEVQSYRKNSLGRDEALALTRTYDSIREEIVSAATRAVPKTTWQRLQFWKG